MQGSGVHGGKCSLGGRIRRDSGMGLVASVRGAVREVFEISAVFVAAGVGFTALSIAFSEASFKIGTFRPFSAIPPHLATLAAVGLMIGLVASLFSGRLSLKLVLLSVTMILLFDLDHAGAAFGIPQPIRPAHSLLFLAIVIAGITVVLRKPLGTRTLIIADFLGHVGTDSGVFPILYPFSLHYFNFGSAYPWLLGGAFFFAALAGLLTRRQPSLLKPVRS